jgi:hypothetical protein
MEDACSKLQQALPGFWQSLFTFIQNFFRETFKVCETLRGSKWHSEI